MRRLLLALSVGGLAALPSLAQPTVLGDPAYNDTVRVLLLTNGSAGGENFCSPFTRPVFEKTEAFVRKALSTLPAANVQVRRSQNFPWTEVAKLWPGRLPHVIVHINAGWGDPSPHIADVLNTAADSAIGVVSIGDDAGDFAQKIFKLTKVENEPLPMKDGRILEEAGDSLWIQLKRESDTLPSHGVIRNTVDSLKRRTLLFKPFKMNGQGDIRCQADADDYSEVDPADKDMLTFLGFQRGYDHSAGRELHPPEDLQVIVTFQDHQRRGVALSFQPQYLVDSTAAWQVVYDAILFASFAHTYHAAGLVFTQGRDGASLPAGSWWSPAQGRLYLTYTDDQVGPDQAKSFVITSRNRQGKAPADSEVVTAKPASIRDGKGIWWVEIPLAESRSPARLDGRLQTYVIGEVEAYALSHGEDGTPDGGRVQASLRVAYPDAPETVRILDAAQAATPVDRSTPNILLRVEDQDFSSLPDDTVVVQLECRISGDRLADVPLRESARGVYQSAAIAKIESALPVADGTLGCAPSDTLQAVYVDQVHGRRVVATVGWKVPPVLVNPVVGAYIKDIDGNGAGDQVFIRFERPVDSLPATLDTAYWNEVGPAFARRPAKIGYLPGTDRKTLMADFSGSEFGAGLTSIPPGARPYLVLTPDPVFAGQRADIADSLGPVLLAGTLYPFSLADGTTSNLPDTLDLVLSEPLRARSGWSVLVRFSPSRNGACRDYETSSVIAAEPLRVEGVRLRIPSALENGPARGDCVYLNLDGGYTDTLGNPPPRVGVRLQGPDPSGRIVRVQGHPPVAGCAACDPVASGPLTWIPPVGHVAGAPFREFPVPAKGDRPVGTDPGQVLPLPDGLSTVQVVSTGAYIAHITLFDNYGVVVRRLGQSFGYRGELENRARYRNRTWTSYLAWDGRDEAGREAGQGMYIWKIRFDLEDGSAFARTLRTGYLRGAR